MAKVVIERKEGVSIYGEILANNKLGRFTVNNGPEMYFIYQDAVNRRNAVIGVKSSNIKK